MIITVEARKKEIVRFYWVATRQFENTYVTYFEDSQKLLEGF